MKIKNNFPNIDETSYGFNKRLNYFFDFLKKIKKSKLTILDIGCGTGELLSIPLAQKGLNIVAIDLDIKSINYAKKIVQKNKIQNIKFKVIDLTKIKKKFDVVILSEVIEHVKYPQKFMRMIHERLNPGGYLLITLPNGYGPFEIDQFLWKRIFFFISDFVKKMSQLKKRSQPNKNSDLSDTLNQSSPHINFFSWKKIQKLFQKSNFKMIDYQSRTFICGNFFSLFLEIFVLLRIKTNFLINFNAYVANFLPYWLNSDWMFICQKNIKYIQNKKL